MLICPSPWSDARSVDAGTVDGIRPILVTGRSRAPRLGGFRDRPRAVCGAAGSYELPRPLLSASRQSVTVEGGAIRLAVPEPVPDDDGGCPGELLASRAAAIAAWLDDAGRHSAGTCTALRARLLAELAADDPPESLVVEVARRHRFHVQSVFADPRVQLRRRRELQQIDRVRQLDAASLRWLARQPGRTVAERAGPSERILAVKRFRSINTLENQVLLDVVRRSVGLAIEYERLYRGYPKSERLREVRDLHRGFNDLLMQGWDAEVRKLTEVPVPNYALLSDRRYSRIWRLWQRLLRHEQLFQSLEAWMPRLIAELVWVGVLAEFEARASFRPALGTFPPLRFRPEFECAEFLNQVQPMPPIMGQPIGIAPRIDLARADGLSLVSGVPSSAPTEAWKHLAAVRPDFAMVSRPTTPRAGCTCLAVWAVVTWSAEDCDALSRAVIELDQVVRRFQVASLDLVPIVVAFRGAGPRFSSPHPEVVRLLHADGPATTLAEVPSTIAGLAGGICRAR
jgi:hypothetical protein